MCSFYVRLEESRVTLDRVFAIPAVEPVSGSGVDVHVVGDAPLAKDLLQFVCLLYTHVPVRVAVQDQDRWQTAQVQVLPFWQTAVVLHHGRNASIPRRQ